MKNDKRPKETDPSRRGEHDSPVQQDNTLSKSQHQQAYDEAMKNVDKILEELDHDGSQNDD